MDTRPPAGPDRFASFDGVELAYWSVGDTTGDPVLLLHGFAADSVINWFRPGVAAALVQAGLGLFALDARGHGSSDKPHDPNAYTGDAMVTDVGALADHLGLERYMVVGYSMGGGTALKVAATEPRATRVVAAGVGARGRGRPRREPGRSEAGGSEAGRSEADRPLDRGAISRAMTAGDAGSISDSAGRAFRAFAESTGADLAALAAVATATAAEDPPRLGDVKAPLLVVAGDDDDIAGDPYRLALAIPGARAAVVPGNHLSAVGTPEFSRQLVDFLTGTT